MKTTDSLWYGLAVLQPVALVVMFPVIFIFDGGGGTTISTTVGLLVPFVYVGGWLLMTSAFIAMTVMRSERRWYPFVTAILLAQPVYFVLFGLDTLLPSIGQGIVYAGLFPALWVLGRGVTVLGMAVDFWSASDRKRWVRAVIILGMAGLILLPLAGVLAALVYLLAMRETEQDPSGPEGSETRPEQGSSGPEREENRPKQEPSGPERSDNQPEWDISPSPRES
jgi:hypothetical protein